MYRARVEIYKDMFHAGKWQEIFIKAKLTCKEMDSSFDCHSLSGGLATQEDTSPNTDKIFIEIDVVLDESNKDPEWLKTSEVEEIIKDYVIENEINWLK